MTSRTDIDAIVEGLSEAMKSAVCGMFAWATPEEADAGEHALRMRGICDKRGGLTDLGYLVRSALLEARER